MFETAYSHQGSRPDRPNHDDRSGVVVEKMNATGPTMTASATMTLTASGSESFLSDATSAGAASAATRARATNARCRTAPRTGRSRVATRWAYRYPRNTTPVKKHSEVVQTAGDPPNTGSTSRPASISSTNSRNAEIPMVER